MIPGFSKNRDSFLSMVDQRKSSFSLPTPITSHNQTQINPQPPPTPLKNSNLKFSLSQTSAYYSTRHYVWEGWQLQVPAALFPITTRLEEAALRTFPEDVYLILEL